MQTRTQDIGLAWWMPYLFVVEGVAIAIAYSMLCHTHPPPAGVVLVGMISGQTSALIEKIERFRMRGLSVFTAVDLAADQHEVDADLLGAVHFAWLLDQYGHPFVEESVGKAQQE